MRKVIAAATASLLVLAACSDSNDSTSSTDPASTESTAEGSPTTGAVTPTQPTVPKPSVKLPASAPTELVITDLKPGTGDKAESGDTVVVRYVGVRSKDGKEFDNNYEAPDPFSVELGAGRVIKGWDQGLIGAQAGGQRQLDIPSALAYGEQSQGDIIGPNEDLSFVIDIVAVYGPADPANEPAIVIAPTKATEVTIDELVPGTGVAAEEGKTAVFHYIFFRGDTGAKLFSSWTSDPAIIKLVTGYGPNDALVKGVFGLKVGGRRQITVPGSQIFEGKGDSGLGLPAGADVVMVADLIAVY